MTMNNCSDCGGVASATILPFPYKDVWVRTPAMVEELVPPIKPKFLPSDEPKHTEYSLLLQEIADFLNT